jgi:hypothetical protein
LLELQAIEKMKTKLEMEKKMRHTNLFLYQQFIIRNSQLGQKGRMRFAGNYNENRWFPINWGHAADTCLWFWRHGALHI